jgi:hypothetical protein
MNEDNNAGSTKGSDNIFKDLGFDDLSATKFLKQAQEAVAAKLKLKKTSVVQSTDADKSAEVAGDTAIQAGAEKENAASFQAVAESGEQVDNFELNKKVFAWLKDVAGIEQEDVTLSVINDDKANLVIQSAKSEQFIQTLQNVFGNTEHGTVQRELNTPAFKAGTFRLNIEGKIALLTYIHSARRNESLLIALQNLDDTLLNRFATKLPVDYMVLASKYATFLA